MIVDCGATKHFVNNEDYFIDFDDKYRREEERLTLANGDILNYFAVARGTAKIHLRDKNGISHEAILPNALYVPTFPRSILSVKSATEKGGTVILGADGGTLRTKNGVEIPIGTKDRLYTVKAQVAMKQHRETKPSYADIVKS